MRDLDPEMQKVLGRTLRFVAHTNGATLCYMSNLHAGAAAADATADKPLLDNFSKLMNHLIFTGLEKKPQLKVWTRGVQCSHRSCRLNGLNPRHRPVPSGPAGLETYEAASRLLLPGVRAAAVCHGPPPTPCMLLTAHRSHPH